MTVLVACAIIFFILFFPLKINFYTFINVEKKISTFGVYLYFLKILSGYAGILASDLYLNIGKKILKTPLIEIVKSNTGVVALKHVAITKIDLLFEYGSTTNMAPVYLWTAFNSLGGVIEKVLERLLKTSVNGNYILSTENDGNNLYVKGIAVSNLFLIVTLLVKVIIGKVKNEQR